jgi:hypothetical protein
MVITMTPGIPDPAEIAEVDDVGWNPETPQHDDVQRWCDLYHTHHFGRPRGRERGVEVERAAAKERGEEARGLRCVFLSLSWPPLYIVGRGSTNPSTKAVLGAAAKEERRRPGLTYIQFFIVNYTPYIKE